MEISDVTASRHEWPAAGQDGPVSVAEELVSFTAPQSLEADQYRTLRHVVERLSRDASVKVIAVTSPVAGDGKTMTTLNLAGSLAQSAATRVLVIDADLHRPEVAGRLGLAGQRGLGIEETLLDESCRLTHAARRLDALNISVLTSSGTHPRPYELLTGSRLESLMAEARAAYDFVLVDTPPVVPLTDCRILGRWVDGFIVVVGANRTPRQLVAEAIGVLDPAKVVGVVFNGDDQPLSASYGDYGYPRYGQATPKPASRLSARWMKLVSHR
jgi:capsular exopolysaccharide synthesis family protein